MANNMNDLLDSLLKIKELIGDGQRTASSPSTQDTEVHEIALEELRIIYGRLDDSMSTIKIRILTFLGGGLALLSYLYSGENLFIPEEPYGKVFYFFGLGLIVSGICLLLHALKPSYWAVPIESKLTKLHNQKTRTEILSLLVEEYVESMVGNIARYEKKVPYLTTGFFQLLCGGTILLVIRNIGG
jgi:hypothetical protein